MVNTSTSCLYSAKCHRWNSLIFPWYFPDNFQLFPDFFDFKICKMSNIYLLYFFIFTRKPENKIYNKEVSAHNFKIPDFSLIFTKSFKIFPWYFCSKLNSLIFPRFPWSGRNPAIFYQKEDISISLFFTQQGRFHSDQFLVYFRETMVVIYSAAYNCAWSSRFDSIFWHPCHSRVAQTENQSCLRI